MVVMVIVRELEEDISGLNYLFSFSYIECYYEEFSKDSVFVEVE